MASTLTLRLPYRSPYDWAGVLAFLTPRAIPGVESVENGVYRRTISLEGARGTVEIRATAEPLLLATITLDRLPALAAIAARLRHLFDLDADPEPIAAHLRRDPALASRVAARPGLRVPGGWDAFELAVRATLGQQVSVSAASTLAGRLVGRFGEPLGTSSSDRGLRVLFPEAKTLVHADLSSIGIPRTRAAAISIRGRSSPPASSGSARARRGAGTRIVSPRFIPPYRPWWRTPTRRCARARPTELWHRLLDDQRPSLAGYVTVGGDPRTGRVPHEASAAGGC